MKAAAGSGCFLWKLDPACPSDCLSVSPSARLLVRTAADGLTCIFCKIVIIFFSQCRVSGLSSLCSRCDSARVSRSVCVCAHMEDVGQTEAVRSLEKFKATRSV